MYLTRFLNVRFCKRMYQCTVHIRLYTNRIPVCEYLSRHLCVVRRSFCSVRHGGARKSHLIFARRQPGFALK